MNWLAGYLEKMASVKDFQKDSMETRSSCLTYSLSFLPEMALCGHTDITDAGPQLKIQGQT